MSAFGTKRTSAVIVVDRDFIAFPRLQLRGGWVSNI